MSASQFDEFDRRMRRIERRHTQLSRGYVTSVNEDGLVVAKPKRKLGRATWRGVALVVLVLMGFKAFLHSQLGDTGYAERIASLSDGSVFEQAGAVLMAADPITLWLSAQISSFL